jgi:hypothetical protein
VSFSHVTWLTFTNVSEGPLAFTFKYEVLPLWGQKLVTMYQAKYHYISENTDLHINEKIMMKLCALERMNDLTHAWALRFARVCSLIHTWTDSQNVTIIMTVNKLDQWGIYCYISHYQIQLMLKGWFCTAWNLHVH